MSLSEKHRPPMKNRNSARLELMNAPVAAQAVINSTLAIYTAPSGVTFPARTSLA